MSENHFSRELDVSFDSTSIANILCVKTTKKIKLQIADKIVTSNSELASGDESTISAWDIIQMDSFPECVALLRAMDEFANTTSGLPSINQPGNTDMEIKEISEEKVFEKHLFQARKTSTVGYPSIAETTSLVESDIAKNLKQFHSFREVLMSSESNASDKCISALDIIKLESFPECEALLKVLEETVLEEEKKLVLQITEDRSFKNGYDQRPYLEHDNKGSLKHKQNRQPFNNASKKKRI